MKKQLTIIAFGILILLLLQFPAWGMDNENPANLALPGTHFELAAPGVGIESKNNLIDYGFLNLDMTDPAVKESFLGKMENGYFKMNTNIELEPSLTIGRLQLKARSWSGTTVNLASGWTDFLFNGYEPNKEYKLAGTKINGIAAASLDLSYGHPLLVDEPFSLGFGFTFHYLEGLALADFEIINGKITTDEYAQAQYNYESTAYTNIPLDFSLENIPLGDSTGYTYDLGMVYKNNRLTTGVVLKNLGPGINWKGITLWKDSASGSLNGGSSGPEIANPDETYDKQTNVDLTTKFPLVLDITADYQLIPRHIITHFGYEKGFADGWGISSTPRYWAGLDLETLRIIRLAGEVGWQGKQLDVQALAELRLWILWLNAKLGWTGDFSPLSDKTSGFSVASTVKIHF